MTDKINQTAALDVQSWLGKSTLGGEAFKLTTGENEQLMEIIYRDRPEFRFSLSKSERTGFTIREAPGNRLTSEEEYADSNIDRCFNRVQSWIRRVENEILAPPTPGLSEDEIRTLQEILDGMTNPQDPFDADELLRFEQAVDETLDRFQEEIDAIAVERDKDKARFKKELDDLRRQIEADKTTLSGAMSKNAYGRKVMSQLWKFAKNKTKDGVNFAIEAGTKALLQGMLGGG